MHQDDILVLLGVEIDYLLVDIHDWYFVDRVVFDLHIVLRPEELEQSRGTNHHYFN